MKRELLNRLRLALAEKKVIATVTRLPDGAQGLVDATEAPAGDLAFTPEQLERVRWSLGQGQSGVIEVGGESLFVRSYRPRLRLLIVGAVHITQALAPMATLAGFEVVVIDPRRAFGSDERFPGVSLTSEWPDEALRRLGLDAGCAVVAVTHDPKLDDPALVEALNSPAFYIGALGSKRTHAQRVDRLTEQGLADRLHRIHAPVGLDLGGRSPGEIAVAVLAQIIQVYYGKKEEKR